MTGLRPVPNLNVGEWSGKFYAHWYCFTGGGYDGEAFFTEMGDTAEEVVRAAKARYHLISVLDDRDKAPVWRVAVCELCGQGAAFTEPGGENLIDKFKMQHFCVTWNARPLPTFVEAIL